MFFFGHKIGQMFKTGELMLSLGTFLIQCWQKQQYLI